MAAAVIPWKVILQALPAVVVTAKQLWSHWQARPKAAVDSKADAKTQLASLVQRLAALEEAETAQAKLVSEMAEQLQAIARRASIAYWLGISAVALSCIALLVAALR